MNAQIDPRYVVTNKTEVPLKPDDGRCYKLIKTLEEIKHTPELSKESIWTKHGGHQKVYYNEIQRWESIVCDTNLSLEFYQVLFAALTEKGLHPKENYAYKKYIRDYEKDIKEKALSCMFQYQENLKMPVGNISFRTLDSLEIQLDQLDELKKLYNIKEPSKKELLSYTVKFDLELLDDDGLIGPADGKRALDYSFSIPTSESKFEEVKAIDPSVELLRKFTRKETGMGEDIMLCKGNTHQENYLDILLKLSKLSYVHEIHQFHYKN